MAERLACFLAGATADTGRSRWPEGGGERFGSLTTAEVGRDAWDAAPGVVAVVVANVSELGKYLYDGGLTSAAFTGAGAGAEADATFAYLEAFVIGEKALPGDNGDRGAAARGSLSRDSTNRAAYFGLFRAE